MSVEENFILILDWNYIEQEVNKLHIEKMRAKEIFSEYMGIKVRNYYLWKEKGYIPNDKELIKFDKMVDFLRLDIDKVVEPSERIVTEIKGRYMVC